MPKTRAVGRSVDLWVGPLFALLTLLIVLYLPEAYAPLRIGLGFLLALLLPGYALMAVLFPGTQDAEGIERLVACLGLSIIATPIVGLVLHYTPWGLNLGSVALALTSVVVLASGVAWLRRRTLEPGLRFAPLADLQFSRGLALSIALLLVAFVVVGTSQSPARFTEFYVLGEGNRMDSYPVDVRAGETFYVTLTVVNREGREMRYEVRTPFDPKPRPLEVELADGAVWEATLEFQNPETYGTTRLPLELYLPGESSPYRLIYLIVNVQP